VEGTLRMSNRDTFPIGSTRLRFCRADVGSGSDAATVVVQFQGEGLPAEEIKCIPWRLLSLDDLRVVMVFESSFLGMKANINEKEEVALIKVEREGGFDARRQTTDYHVTRYM
jgi:hypothetical protein